MSTTAPPARRWKGIVGRAFTPADFDVYCHALQWTAWRPSFVVLHNTAVPSLAQRPTGFTRTHLAALEHYYRDDAGWKAGPHLFVDDHAIWVFTPLTVSGVHSPSWNKLALGVEQMGDYSTEAYATGRGAAVRDNTVAALATLHAILGIDSHSLKFHYEDPLTTHACPGKNCHKADVVKRVHDLIVARHGGDHLRHVDPDTGLDHNREAG